MLDLTSTESTDLDTQALHLHLQHAAARARSELAERDALRARIAELEQQLTETKAEANNLDRRLRHWRQLGWRIQLLDQPNTLPLCPNDWHAECQDVARKLHDLLPPSCSFPVRTILAELERASQKFPTWPTDPLHALGVLGEEFGELTKAVMQTVYEPHKSTADDVAGEAVQTAAMAFRFVMSLNQYSYSHCPQHRQAPLPAQQPETSEAAPPAAVAECVRPTESAPLTLARDAPALALPSANDLADLIREELVRPAGIEDAVQRAAERIVDVLAVTWSAGRESSDGS